MFEFYSHQSMLLLFFINTINNPLSTFLLEFGEKEITEIIIYNTFDNLFNI